MTFIESLLNQGAIVDAARWESYLIRQEEEQVQSRVLTQIIQYKNNSQFQIVDLRLVCSFFEDVQEKVLNFSIFAVLVDFIQLSQVLLIILF